MYVDKPERILNAISSDKGESHCEHVRSPLSIRRRQFIMVFLHNVHVDNHICIIADTSKIIIMIIEIYWTLDAHASWDGGLTYVIII